MTERSVMMKKRKILLFAGIALAVLAKPVGEAIGGTCIISGSTERECSDSAWNEPYASFDSRQFAWGVAEPLPEFYSTEPRGLVIFVK